MLNVMGSEGHAEALKKAREHNPTAEKMDNQIKNVHLNINAALPEPEEILDQMRRDGKLPPKSIMDNIEKMRVNSVEESVVKKNKNN